MNKNKIKEKVAMSLDLLYKYDLDLISNDTNERSISHKLAEYFQQQFPGWHVDCEYNRKMGDIKKLKYSFDNLSPKDNEAKTVYPDIIVHKRNTDQNILVVEIKKVEYDRFEKDKEKLKEFTRGDGGYKYNYGLFIIFDGTQNPKLTWFVDGKELNKF